MSSWRSDTRAGDLAPTEKRPMKMIVLKKVTHTGSGQVSVLSEPINQPNFRVDRLGLKVTLTVKNTNAAGQTLSSEGIGQNSTVKVDMADGRPMYNSVAWRALEWLWQTMVRGYLDALLETADRSITAVSGATEEQDFYIDVPFADPSAANPTDYSQALSLIKTVELNIGATGNSDLTITQVVAQLVAFGEWMPRHRYIGARTYVTEAPNIAGSDSVDIPLSGRRLTHLVLYSKAQSTSPVAMNGPKVVDDTDFTLLDFTNVSALEVQKFMGQRGFSTFPARSALTQDNAAPLLLPPKGYEISKQRISSKVSVKSQSNAGTNGEQAFIVRSIVPHDSTFLEQMPGTKEPGAQVTVQTPGGVLTDEVGRFLPKKIYSDAAGRCGC